jgi:hypothetical protein
MFQKSTDGGLTWLSEERKLADHVGGWDIQIPGIYRANGFPFLMSDMSGGPHNGTLYLNWCDQRNGTDNTDVWLIKSTDAGQTWSAPIQVNQDKDSRHQFLTSMAIDQVRGDLHFVYYDRRRFKDTFKNNASPTNRLFQTQWYFLVITSASLHMTGTSGPFGPVWTITKSHFGLGL